MQLNQLHQILKSETDLLHRQAEQVSPMGVFAQEKVSQEDYQRSIRYQLSVVSQLDFATRTLQQQIPLLREAVQRVYGAAQKTGIEFSGDDEIILSQRLQRLDMTYEASLGVLYVLSGSFLGHQLIAGMRKKGKFDFEPAFFTMSSKEGSQFFRKCLVFIQAHAGSRDAIAAILQGACVAFEVFIDVGIRWNENHGVQLH